jgi:hypothetical protein
MKFIGMVVSAARAWLQVTMAAATRQVVRNIMLVPQICLATQTRLNEVTALRMEKNLGKAVSDWNCKLLRSIADAWEDR